MILTRRRRMGGKFAFQREEDSVFVAVESDSWENAEPIAVSRLRAADAVEFSKRRD